jgi:hypothetical protein
VISMLEVELQSATRYRPWYDPAQRGRIRHF